MNAPHQIDKQHATIESLGGLIYELKQMASIAYGLSDDLLSPSDKADKMRIDEEDYFRLDFCLNDITKRADELERQWWIATTGGE